MCPSRSRNPRRAGQWDPGHGRGFNRQSSQVLTFQVVHVGLAAGPGQCRDLHVDHLQVIADPLGGLFWQESLLETFILSGDTDRAATGLAVVAEPGCRAQLLVVVRAIHPPLAIVVAAIVASQRNQRSLAD